MKKLLVALALVLLPALASAEIHEEAVVYSAGDTELHGYLCYDDSSTEKRPGVLVVHEWWGLNEYARKRAADLAGLGYVALALDLYGEGKTTEHPGTAGEWASTVTDELRLDRFEAARELLRSHELVDGDRIAAIGYCFGGGAVLRLALAGVDLKGVVSFHGALPTQSVEPGVVKAKILACHGAADPFVEPSTLQKFQDMLAASGAEWQLNVYGGAKHSFTVETAAERGMEQLEYNATADHRSWAEMRMFLEEVLR